MPKKKSLESQAEQSERFQNAVRGMMAAGELSPTEADERFEHLTSAILKIKQAPPSLPDGGAPDTC